MYKIREDIYNMYISRHTYPEYIKNIYKSVGQGRSFFGYTAQRTGSQFPDQRSNPCPLQWKHGVLTTGPPGNSQKWTKDLNKNLTKEDIQTTNKHEMVLNLINHFNFIKMTIVSSQLDTITTHNKLAMPTTGKEQGPSNTAGGNLNY